MDWDWNVLIWALICALPLVLLYRPQSSDSPPRGCRRLGLTGQSNLHDEFDLKYRQGVQCTTNGEPAWHVKALFTYPLKSCGEIELQESDVVATGLKWDRQFVFAQHSSDGWTCRTLRNAGFQRLALIRPEIWIPDPTASDYDSSLPEVKSQGVMLISYPCHPLPGRIGSLISRVAIGVGLIKSTHSFRIPLCPKDTDTSFPLTPVKIWKDKPLAYNYGRLLPASLHTYLGFDPQNSPLSLFRACPQHSREIFRNAPRKETIGFQPNTAFADAYPIHMLNLASHHDVASRCKAIPNLSIRRFRANIVIQGPGPFEEDSWTKLSVGGIEVYAACRTVRCKLPNVDPDTGERHLAEPDQTLKSYRRIDDGDRTNACLGMQLVPAVEDFCLRVGDVIGVLEVGEHRYIKMLAPGEKIEGV